MNAHVCTTATVDGPFMIVMVAGQVIASGWTTDVGSLVTLVHPDLRPRSLVVIAPGDEPGMSAAVGAVAAHYDGDPGPAASIDVRQQSGPFRMLAWEVLRSVAAGAPITYTEFAVRAGAPAAVRAAAAACSRNAAALFVPCHRVIRSDGSLGGFRYGLAIKQRLIDGETGPATPPGLRGRGAP